MCSITNIKRECITLNSSFGITKPHPFSHGNGRFGLCSHSSRWLARASSLSTMGHPYSSLSQAMLRRERRLRRIRGTARKLAATMLLRSTGQVGWRDSHSVMQARQKACSQTAAWWKTRNGIYHILFNFVCKGQLSMLSDIYFRVKCLHITTDIK